MPSNSTSRYARYFGACLGLTFLAFLLLALPRGTFAPGTELIKFRLASIASIQRDILATTLEAEDTNTSPSSTSPSSSSSLACDVSPCAPGMPSLVRGQGAPAPGDTASYFKALPWLLPPRHSELTYSGVYNLDSLAALRAQHKAGYSTITVTFFSRGMVDMLQNCIYSMVKFGLVDNYIVAVWTQEDLEACIDLNLPCADVREHMPRALGPEPVLLSPSPEPEKVSGNTPSPSSETDAAKTTSSTARRLLGGVPEFESRDYNTIMWTKPAVVQHLLRKGYAVHSTDIDLAYAPKDVWASYLNFLKVSGADAAFQVEGGNSPINSGNYVALPNERVLEMMSAWMAQAKKGVDNGGNQKGLQEIYNTGAFKTCQSVEECQAAAQARLRATLDGEDLKNAALIRTYNVAGWEAHKDYCAFSGSKPLPTFSPCDSSVMFVHPVCTPSGIDRVLTKTRVLRESGFWFMDGGGLRAGNCPRDENESSSGLPRCVPLAMKWPLAHVEAEFEACDNHIAFT